MYNIEISIKYLNDIIDYLNLHIISDNGWHPYSNGPEFYTLVENEKLEIILSKIKSMNLEYTRHPSMFQNRTAIYVKSDDVKIELRNNKINTILND